MLLVRWGLGGIISLGFERMSCFIYGQKLLAKALLGFKYTINYKLAKHTRVVVESVVPNARLVPFLHSLRPVGRRSRANLNSTRIITES